MNWLVELKKQYGDRLTFCGGFFFAAPWFALFYRCNLAHLQEQSNYIFRYNFSCFAKLTKKCLQISELIQIPAGSITVTYSLTPSCNNPYGLNYRSNHSVQPVSIHYPVFIAGRSSCYRLRLKYRSATAYSFSSQCSLKILQVISSAAR